MELIKPTILSSTKLSNLIFQRKDIYCLLESLVKNIGTNFESLGDNDENLRLEIERCYNELIVKIDQIISGDQEIDLDFYVKPHSIDIEKLSQDVLDLIKSAKQTIEIDTENNILTDLATGIKYKLIRDDAQPTIEYGDIEITEFEYPTNISADGVQMSLMPELSYKQEKITVYPDGRTETDYIIGNRNTEGVELTYSIENEYDWIRFVKETGALQPGANPTENSVSVNIKVKVKWHGFTSLEKSFTVTQQASYFNVTPTSLTFEWNDDEAKTIRINHSNTYPINNVERGAEWLNIEVGDSSLYVLPDYNNGTSSRTANVIINYGNNKTKTITVTQKAKAVVNEFYYGGATSIDEIPEDINEIPYSTEKLTIKDWNVESTDKYKLIYFNLPNNYKITQIENEAHDIIDFIGPKIIEDRVIYYTDPSKVYRPLSNKYTITITKK